MVIDEFKDYIREKKQSGGTHIITLVNGRNILAGKDREDRLVFKLPNSEQRFSSFKAILAE
jgi:hypothetical protein